MMNVFMPKDLIEFVGVWSPSTGYEQITTEPIIRCRDCEHKAGDGDWCCRTEHEFAIDLDGFCAWGLRRKEDE